ncbi:hypothetical protein [Rhodopirellula sp. SWK7]|uniref:hypothetical protein n=1 Tax=Rhodopirellula sp. SWK7 TaxID=595460 RepID=UPI001F2BD6B2|nr:hypothetical protein [Rhodopirellula sp. SWK7]
MSVVAAPGGWREFVVVRLVAVAPAVDSVPVASVVGVAQVAAVAVAAEVPVQVEGHRPAVPWRAAASAEQACVSPLRRLLGPSASSGLGAVGCSAAVGAPVGPVSRSEASSHAGAAEEAMVVGATAGARSSASLHLDPAPRAENRPSYLPMWDPSGS